MAHLVTDSAGVVHSFPDEATPEQISAALGLGADVTTGTPTGEVRSAPPQATGLARYVRGAGEAAIRGGIHAVGFLGDVLPDADPNATDEYGLPSPYARPPTTNELL